MKPKHVLSAPVAAVTAAIAFAGSMNQAYATSTLTVTELSSRKLAVSFQLLGVQYPQYTGNGVLDNVNGADTWNIGTTYGGLPLFFPRTTDQSSWTYGVAWREPDNPNLYNGIEIQPSGNRGNTNILIMSDMTFNYLAQTFNEGEFFFHPFETGACRSGGSFTSCSILPNGASYVTPISNFGTDLGTLTLTFNDRSDVGSGVPESSTWMMMLIGFLGVGRLGDRRAKKAAKAGGRA